MVRKRDLDRRRRLLRVEPFVRRARVVRATRGRQQKITGSGVKDNQERLAPDRNFAVVLARVNNFRHRRRPRLSHRLAEHEIRLSAL